MRKTLLYTSDYPPARGGVARYLFGLAEFFRDRVEVVVADERHRRWWSAAAWFVTRRSRYDRLLVSHVLPFGTAAMVAGLITRKPYVVIVHGMDVGLAKQSNVKRFVAGIVLRRATTVVVNSASLEREVRQEFWVRRPVVVYPSVSSPSTRPEPIAGRPNSVRLLTVARLVSRKGHLRVLDAIRVLRDKHPDFSVSYAIVGDGPMRAAIESAVRDLGLQDVRIVTDVSDDLLPSYYAAADALVMPVVRDPVDREGFGMVYLEAAAYGVPSIATNMPGIDEAVINEETGILVEDGDIAGLADAVYRLAADAFLRARLGEAAFRRAHEVFAPDRQFSKLNDLL